MGPMTMQKEPGGVQFRNVPGVGDVFLPDIPSMTPPSAGAAGAAGVGTKYDADKLRLDLWPLRAYLSIGAVITLGAKKYAPRNWQKLESFDDRFYSALMRHLTSWRLGEKNDPETGLPHLAHAGCNLVFLLSKELGFDPDPADGADASHPIPARRAGEAGDP
jgi:Domain of unknown function (DUF5664)